MAEVITVSALNRYVKTLLDANDALFDLALRARSQILYRMRAAGTAIFLCGMMSAASKR